MKINSEESSKNANLTKQLNRLGVNKKDTFEMHCTREVIIWMNTDEISHRLSEKDHSHE